MWCRLTFHGRPGSGAAARRPVLAQRGGRWLTAAAAGDSLLNNPLEWNRKCFVTARWEEISIFSMAEQRSFALCWRERPCCCGDLGSFVGGGASSAVVALPGQQFSPMPLMKRPRFLTAGGRPAVGRPTFPSRLRPLSFACPGPSLPAR